MIEIYFFRVCWFEKSISGIVHMILISLEVWVLVAIPPPQIPWTKTIPYHIMSSWLISSYFLPYFCFLYYHCGRCMYGIMACCWLCDIFLTYNNVVLLRWLFPVLDVSLNFCLCLFDVVCAESTCKWPQTQTGQFLNYPFWISSFLV